jgi:hypothetical protein
MNEHIFQPTTKKRNKVKLFVSVGANIYLSFECKILDIIK